MTTTTYHKDEAGARSASLVMRKFDFFRELDFPSVAPAESRFALRELCYVHSHRTQRQAAKIIAGEIPSADARSITEADNALTF